MMHKLITAAFGLAAILLVTPAEAKRHQSTEVAPAYDIHTPHRQADGAVVEARHKKRVRQYKKHVAKPTKKVEIKKAEAKKAEVKVASLTPVDKEPEQIKPVAVVVTAVAKLVSSSIEVIQAVDDAREYLIKTATPGGTMTKLGPTRAITELHPVFAVRLAGAVAEGRRSGLPRVGCYSAMRHPFLGVGGYANKFDSNHAYGLACDIEGIGRPGSWQAKLWHKIATKHGLHNPYYGTGAYWEWNHYQATPVITAVKRLPALRKTITGRGPVDLPKMWQVADRVLYLEPERYAGRQRSVRKSRTYHAQYAAVHTVH